MRVNWRLQAAMITHTAPASSWLPSWVHWHQVLLTLPLAFGASWVSLSLRYRHKARPFGTPKAAWRAVTVIVLTAVLATAVSVVLPRLPAVSVGLLVPALLCAERLPKGEREPVAEQPPWFGLITGGVSLLLSWLEDQTALDRLEWAERKVAEEVHSLGDLVIAAENVQSTVSTLTCGRTGSGRLKHELKADYDGVIAAVAKAREATNPDEARKARHSAERALVTMLGRAYAWRCTKITLMPTRQLV